MRTRLLCLLVGCVLVVAGCETVTPSSTPRDSTAPSHPSDGNRAPQVLRVDISGEPETLDPTNAESGRETTVLKALNSTLVRLDERLEVVPALAETWDISGDAKTLTFHLRDARYSNGDPIVADDLVYSWKRLVDPRTAAGYSYVMAEVEGTGELLGMDPKALPPDAEIDAALDKVGVDAPDTRTFVVHLRNPVTWFLSAATLWVFAPIQEEWITGTDATEAANYVSSGPFVLDTWDHESQIVLKRNPNWWGVEPGLAEIQMSMRGDPAQAQLAYEAGELDIVVTPPEDVDRVRNDPGLGAEYRETDWLGVSWLAFNNYQDPSLASFADPGPTANKNFRIALTQAIDKQTFIDATLGGLGTAANSVVMPGIPGYQPDLNRYPFDLDSARAHMDIALAELGVKKAAELGELRFGYLSASGFEPGAAFLAEAWRQAFGLDVDQIESEGGVYYSQRAAGGYDIARGGWLADFPHPHNQLDGLFACGVGNDAQYCNPAFDDLISRASAEANVETQLPIYNQAQAMLMDDAAILPLAFDLKPYEVKPYVAGLTVTPAFSQVPGDDFYETIQILDH